MSSNSIFRRNAAGTSWVKVISGDDYVTISSYDTDQNAQNSTISSIQGDISTLQSQVSTLQSQVTSLQAQVPLEVGEMTVWGGSGTGASIPANRLVCDGSAVSRSTYSALFGVIGTAYGSGNGSTTFNLPDATDSIVRGITAAKVNRATSTNSGSALSNHAHNANTAANNATHSHSGNAGNQSANHTHAVNIGNPTANHTHTYFGGDTSKTTSNISANHSHSRSVGNNSSNHSHAVNVSNANANHAHNVSVGNTNLAHTHTIGVVEGALLIRY